MSVITLFTVCITLLLFHGLSSHTFSHFISYFLSVPEPRSPTYAAPKLGLGGLAAGPGLSVRWYKRILCVPVLSNFQCFSGVPEDFLEISPSALNLKRCLCYKRKKTVVQRILFCVCLVAAVQNAHLNAQIQTLKVWHADFVWFLYFFKRAWICWFLGHNTKLFA